MARPDRTSGTPAGEARVVHLHPADRAGADPAGAAPSADPAGAAPSADPAGPTADPADPAGAAPSADPAGPAADTAGSAADTATADPQRRSDVDAWGRSERARAVARTLYGPIYRHWFRAEWDGIEKIPTSGGALVVANHAGAIPADAPVIMHGIEEERHRAVYGLAADLFRTLPVVSTLWSRVGGVPAHPDNAYRLLADEHQLVLVFPEGLKGTGKRYGERYQLRRFGRGGFVELAMRAGVPVVPIAVVGSEESMPILWKSPTVARLLGLPYAPITANMLLFGPLGTVVHLPAKFTLRVLDPISFDVEPHQARYPRSAVMEGAELVRLRLQDELYDMLRARRSVWFG